MSYRIALNFEDGVTRIIGCKAGEKLLDAAYRQQVNLPVDCADGVCGTCKCLCEQGDYDMGDDYIEDALTAAEAEEGKILTCKMVPSSDCVIQVPVPSSACKLTAAGHEAEVIAVEPAGDAMFILRLRLDEPEALDFLPGQYISLDVPGTDQSRAYSFSSRPGAAEPCFLIRNLPGGLMSGWLAHEAKPGARMRFAGPKGSFFLRTPTRPVLMLAGGTGLAPFLSMLETLAETGTDQPIHLIHGVNRDVDLVESGRLAALAARLPSFTWAACVADPDGTHPLKGYVTHHLTDAHLHAGDVDIYLCGPPPMVEAVRGWLRDKGVEPAHFHYEKFNASETSEVTA